MEKEKSSLNCFYWDFSPVTQFHLLLKWEAYEILFGYRSTVGLRVLTIFFECREDFQLIRRRRRREITKSNQLLDTIEFVFCLMSDPCVRLTPLSVNKRNCFCSRKTFCLHSLVFFSQNPHFYI